MKIIRIGRDASNDHVVDHYSVSRFHAEIRIDDFGGILYVDHSTNGTQINGIMVHNSQCSLKGTEKIHLAGKIAINVQDLISRYSKEMSTVLLPNNSYPHAAPSPRSGNNYGNGTCYGSGNSYGSGNRVNPAMGFGSTLGHFFQHYADFSGRARRSEYWYMVLWNFIFGIIPIVNILWALAVIIPFIALAVRRLHDIGKSGAWILINLIPLVGPVLMLIWLLTDSEPQTNQWGKSPKYNQ